MADDIVAGWEDPDRVEFFVRKQTSPLGRSIDGEFLDFIEPASSWSCLDVGCGPGILTIEAARRMLSAAGADLSAAMVARAEALAAEQGMTNVRFVRTPAEVLPFDDQEFDLAFAASVIFLLPEPVAGLREMVRVVRPGGWVATYQPSPEMSVAANQAFIERAGLRGFEAELMAGWGGAAERYQRFSVVDTEAMYGNAGLVDIRVLPALDGLVLFARGRKPEPEAVGPPRLEATEILAAPIHERAGEATEPEAV